MPALNTRRAPASATATPTPSIPVALVIGAVLASACVVAAAASSSGGGVGLGSGGVGRTYAFFDAMAHRAIGGGRRAAAAAAPSRGGRHRRRRPWLGPPRGGGADAAFVASSYSSPPPSFRPPRTPATIHAPSAARRTLLPHPLPSGWGARAALFATVPSADETLDVRELDFKDLDVSNDFFPEVDAGVEGREDEASAASASASVGAVEADSRLHVNGVNGIITADDGNDDSLETERRDKHTGNAGKERDDGQRDEGEDPLFEGIRSRPKEGGRWDPRDPLGWCASFGTRSPADAARLDALTRLGPGDEGYFDVAEIGYPNVTVVRTPEQARIAARALSAARAEDPTRIHACDTEVMDIDLKEVGAVGNGYVTCLSVYSGPDFDYGLGDGAGAMLWVDNLDDARGVLHEFKPWLEDEGALKVWHNYGFDRHVLFNEGIDVKGFGGDTMHMARLSDTSRMKYSLESLTEDLLGQRKVPMKEIFGERRLRKDGSEGALVDLPPMERLQRDPKFRSEWIGYSANDAKSTYDLYRHLEGTLSKTAWIRGHSLMEYYHMHMRPFGELLTDLERRGVLVATDYLAEVERQARRDRQGHVETFRKWAAEQIGPDGLAMNLASSQQLATFLFGGTKNSKTKEPTEKWRVFKTPRADIPDDAMEAYRAKDEEEPKYVDVKITSFEMEAKKFTASGAPSATADVLRKLAGDPFAEPPRYGEAYDHFGQGQSGHDACVAFFSLTAIGSIDTMIANFLTSLQTLADGQKRVHGSLNINTETGRLSSRKPNLQNQPALEKDKYKIRQAFVASPGNRLIVADYGQLELRLLASMTDCTSMIEAFEAGGDFHSRTALGMFKYIQDAVKNSECLLEWDYANGEPPKPMLKDKYASERRKAKTLNFSIAYGKTAHGLSQDWGVSQKEAEDMLQAWYDSRPEVEKWQKETKAVAKKHGLTRTLMGRYRHLPHAKGGSMKSLGHALRASINTPIQGGAADVAMMAMIKINNSPLIKKLGWILLLQVHDEVILEGPEETAEEAFEEVVKCMQEPWVLGLEKTEVPLLVDGSFVHDNWYDAK
ncbi:hypothetical protein ACHAWF_014731 [Thalassiosira exigua]